MYICVRHRWAGGGGARGGRLPLEARIDGPLLEKKIAPLPQKDGFPLKCLWIFGANFMQFSQKMYQHLHKKIPVA